MKINLGIRRRLAPLLDNGRDEVELMHAILFSLPGSPVLYYGDEIGMGDNIFLGDRDGVRTPMQWTGDRNGGFSRADFAQLYLPPLMDPVYGYQAVNVEAQLRQPNSLLRWLRRLIALRKQHPVFGLGTYEALRPDNPRIFAHVRTYEDDIVLCVHNVARSAQAVELDLSRFEGLIPVEMFGQTAFPADRRAAVSADARPARLLLVPAPERRVMTRRADADRVHPRAALVRLEVAAGEPRVRRRPRDTARHRSGARAAARRGSLRHRDPRDVSAARRRRSRRAQRPAPGSRARAHDQVGHEAARPTTGSSSSARSKGSPGSDGSCSEARSVGAEQTNTSIVFDEELILKVFRRLEAGINPELELLRFLTERDFENIAQLAGWYAYSGRPMDATLGILQQFIAGGRDGFALALDSMSDEPDAFLGSLHRLGEATAQMHTLLGSELIDPTFAPESPSSESLGLLTATIDDEIESLWFELPDDNEDVAPIRGRGEEVRDRLRLVDTGRRHRQGDPTPR